MERTDKGRFAKGHKSWLGKKRAPFSKEWRENIRKAALGKKRKPIEDFEETCSQCSKVFLKIKPSKKQSFCGRSCYHASRIGQTPNRVYPRGEDHHSWRGGINPIHDNIRKSKECIAWRKAVFERDGYACTWCGDSKGGNLVADHIKMFSTHPKLRFKIANGRLLCESCHAQRHSDRLRDLKGQYVKTT